MIVCPSCARRVPPNVATCRCGHAFEPGITPSAVVIDAPEPDRSSASLLALIALGAIALGVLLWMNTRGADSPRTRLADGGHGAPSARPVGATVEQTSAQQVQATPAAASTPTPDGA